MDKDLLIINRYLNRIYGDTPFDKIEGYYALKEFVLVFGYSEEKSKKIIKRYFTNLGHKIPRKWFDLILLFPRIGCVMARTIAFDLVEVQPLGPPLNIVPYDQTLDISSPLGEPSCIINFMDYYNGIFEIDE